MTKLQLALEAARELARRKAQRSATADLSFPQQAKFVLDPGRFVVASCTRRAGKSRGIADKLFNAAKLHAGSIVPYITLTKDSARNIMWKMLQELNEKYELGAEFKEASLRVLLKNGSEIKLHGADQKNYINKLKGGKYPLVAIDEAQAFGGHLEDLVDEVLTPATADYDDGQIVLTGTPGPVPKGYFFNAQKGLYGFSKHFWTVYDNPYMPNARSMVDDLFKKKGWTPENPTYRREWLGEWVSDKDALVYKWTPKNKTESLPQRAWNYILGVDLGYDPDPSAFVLLAYHEHERTSYIIEAKKANRMSVSDVAERIRDYMNRYNRIRVVMDMGALGKMVGEEIRQRYGLPIIAAEKQGKSEMIELMNDDLRAFRLKIVADDGTIGTEDLFEEWNNLIWDATKEKRVEDGRYANHLADSALYAWRHSKHYLATPEPTSMKPQSEEHVNSWWDQQAEILDRNKNQERDIYGDW